MKSVPVPLFNYRKRQCQAILSDPQQLSTSISASNSTKTTFNHQDAGSTEHAFMDKQTLATSNSRNTESRDNAANMRNNAHSTQRLLSNPVKQRNPDFVSKEGRFSGSGISNNTWMQANISKGWTNCQLSNPNTESSMNVNRIQGSNIQQIPLASHRPGIDNRRNSASQRQALNVTTSSSTLRTVTPRIMGSTGSVSSYSYSCSGKVNENTSVNKLDNQKRQYELSGSCGRGYTHQTTTQTRHETRDTINKACVGQTRQSRNVWAPSNNSGAVWNSTSLNTQKNDWKAETVNNIAAICDPDFTGKTSKHQRNKVVQNPQTTDKATAPDLSLRIFTCTIAMIKSWTAQRDCVDLVMFEVYGLIDSAMVRDHTGTGKEFVLRDDTSSITCVFYEIDRDIPRLIRGQVCRVVGLVSGRLEVLHVVSVRAAQMEERQVCQAATQKSQAEMAKLTT